MTMLRLPPTTGNFLYVVMIMIFVTYMYPAIIPRKVCGFNNGRFNIIRTQQQQRCLSSSSSSSSLTFLRRYPSTPSTSRLKSSKLSSSSSSSEDSVRNLLGSVLRRAQTTITEKDRILKENYDNKDYDDSSAPSASYTVEDGTANVLEATILSAESAIHSKQQEVSPPQSSSSTTKTSTTQGSLFLKQKSQETYNGNPAITNTALAHALWSTILRPNIDSAIDTTCGNGYDSVVLAKLLFGENGKIQQQQQDYCQSQLLCLDIQKQACQNTTLALMNAFEGDDQGQNLLEKQHIQVLQTSHAPMPKPESFSLSSVGLVVYNLGWLPRSGKEYTTKLSSTLESIVDAMLLIRIGGMVSVVTYPKTNAQEDLGVRTFLECSALLSSKITKWDEFLDNNVENDDDDDEHSLLLNNNNNNTPLPLLLDDTTRDIVRSSMIRLIENGSNPNQTWRVSEHKKLGMDRAPILITATRIK